MISSANTSENLVLDTNSLSKLKREAKENSPDAIQQVAQQFESIFMNMMLKSMREATPQDSPFENEQSRTFTSMLDQQLSSNMASKGLGLADVLVRQLSKSSTAIEEPASSSEPTFIPSHLISNRLDSTALNQGQPKLAEPNKTLQKSSLESNVRAVSNMPLRYGVSDFKDRMLGHANEASASTGLPAHFMLGQAALESGWGKREIKAADGSNSHNLFGIKAGANWKGKVVETTTTEYINGVKEKRVEKFRAYDSYADSFKDFGHLMLNNPRYKNVLRNLDDIKGYANAIQKAGYATDPQYASKLANVIQKMT